MADVNDRRQMPFFLFPVALVTLLLLAGCVTVGPDYIQPEVVVADKWKTELNMGLKAGQLDTQRLADWWTTFNDPLLTNLVNIAIADNRDLRQAQARIREARAQRGVSTANRFPTVDASGSFSRSRSSKATGSGAEVDFYNVGFDASWELDIFGGKRRSTEVAQANLEASEEDLRDTLVSLLAEVALNYVEVRSFQTRLSIAEANLDAQNNTYDLTRWRYEAGLTTQLDVEQSRYNLEQTRSQLPTLQTGLEQAKNRLAFLLGKSPGFLTDELADRSAIPLAPFEIAVGVPANALRHRPDIRRAERELAAQTARIGVATAEYYPKFSLSGSIGLEALSTGNLLEIANRTQRIAPGFSWNIFDAGRIRQSIEVQNALQEQSLLSYEATILAALEEVENALSAYASEQLRRRSLAEAEQAIRQVVALAEAQYTSGLIDFQIILDAQASLLAAQDNVASSDSEVTSNLIRLYKALGGGWTSLLPAGVKPVVKR